MVSKSEGETGIETGCSEGGASFSSPSGTRVSSATALTRLVSGYFLLAREGEEAITAMLLLLLPPLRRYEKEGVAEEEDEEIDFP